MIKSQRDKCAVVIRPKSIQSFIEDLKVLVDLGYDAGFKLTQTEDALGDIKKFLDILGTS